VWPREIGDEETDEEAIGEPQAKEFRHGGWGAGIKWLETPPVPACTFFLHGRRVHVLMGAKREMIETRRQASRTQGGKKLVLLGERPVVALVILQHHVNEGAGHEYDGRPRAGWGAKEQ